MPTSRARPRRSGVESQSVGLEDELSFGSDEDLMDSVGEIQVPEDTHDTPSIASGSSSTNKSKLAKAVPKTPKPSRSFVRGRKDSTSAVSKASLASTTYLLPPLPPVPAGSTLDLPSDMFSERDKPGSKRGSIMGAFKSKSKNMRGKLKDDMSSHSSFVSDSLSMSSTVSLSKIGSNTCEFVRGAPLTPASRPSVSSSFAHTPASGPSPSSTAPHLAPMAFGASDPAFHSGTKQPTDANMGLHPSLRNLDIIESSGDTTPSPPSNVPVKAWSPKDISSSILPPFPATLSSLEPITVFTAEASKRPSATSRTPFPQRWLPCTLVFTQFKVAVDGDHARRRDAERTVAHIHIYNKPSQGFSGIGSVGSAVRRTRSAAGFNEWGGGRSETERRWLSRSTTASVLDDGSGAGGRSMVMRILWGDDDQTKNAEWLVEMKDTRQLQEWIRQIRKTAIMVEAEELGHGAAMRPAFETRGVSADELAHHLSVHAHTRADASEELLASPSLHPSPAAHRSDRANSAVASPVPIPSPHVLPAQPIPSPSPSAASTGIMSREERRRPSFCVDQGPLLARSLSANEAPITKGNASLGRAHRYAGSDEQVPTMFMHTVQETDWLGPNHGRSSRSTSRQPSTDNLGGLLGGLNLGLAFPTPPSDLPLPPARPQRAKMSAPPRSAVSPPMPTTPLPTSRASSPLPTPSSARSAVTPPMPIASLPTTRVSGYDDDDDDDDEPRPIMRPPTPPPRKSLAPSLQSRDTAPSINSDTASQTSSTRRLRRLRDKPQAIDIMAEFSAIEAENMPEDEDEPIREDRARRIRFAEE